MTTEDDFQARLDVFPGDGQTRLVFADWLQERADPRADGYRALGLLRMHPSRATAGFGPYWHDVWQWHRPVPAADPSARIYKPWRRAFGFAPGDAMNWPTRRAAENAAAWAIVKVAAAHRAKLLRPRGASA